MKYFLFMFAILYFPSIYSQNMDDTLLNWYEKKQSLRPSELLYIQTSKGIYETGEDLWFKIYSLDSQSFGLSAKSRTLYLQIINENDSAVWQEKYPVINGIASGHAYVNDKLKDGDYFLEAYTKHSFFRDTTEQIASRKIRIVKNISLPGQFSTTKNDNSINFKMYPEGGNLVAGLQSKIAFKVTDKNGYPTYAKGTLFKDDQEVIQFNTKYEGMGAFYFTPEVSSKYQIILQDGSKFNIPEVETKGIVLNLSKHNDEYLEFNILKSNSLPNQKITLLGQLRGILCCSASGILKDSLKIKIPIKEFPYQGIAEIALYNELMQPIAERLVYVHSNKKLNITTELDKEYYKIRDKAILKIKVTDDEGRPVRTNLGISITDKAYEHPADPVNIVSYCYLSSQIRGKIHRPDFYFNEKNHGRIEALDLLLLTQGWRRYIWNPYHFPYKGNTFLHDNITGVMTVKNKKMKGSEQFIQVSGAEGNSDLIIADSTGYFVINTHIQEKLRGGYVYLKPMLSKNYGPALLIDEPFKEIDTIRRGKPFHYPFVNLSAFEKATVFDIPLASPDSTLLLNEVTITGKKGRQFRDKFMGRLDSLAQVSLGPWVCEHGYLENYRPGYTHHHDPAYCPCPKEPKERNIPVIGKSYILWKPKYHGNSGNGCAFTVEDSRTIIYEGQNYSEEELLRMNNLWRTKGYYANREFYEPDEVDMLSSIPDARNTLYWSPSIITDEKGEAVISFYCSDVNAKFTGTVEGVDGFGLIGSQKCEFNVVRDLE